MCSIYQVLWLHFELSATRSLSISFSLSLCPKFAWYANLFRLVFVLFFNTYFCVNFIALPTLNTKLDTVKCFDYFCDKISQLRPIVRVSLWEHLTTLLADAEPRPDRVGSKTLWRLPAGTKKRDKDNYYRHYRQQQLLLVLGLPRAENDMLVLGIESHTNCP